MMTTILLVDAALELVPGGDPPAVLDASIHGDVMARLENAEQRGRPDIAHRFLSLCLDSRPYRKGRMRVYVHTRNQEVIRVDREAVPWNYNEFLRKMGRLLQGQPAEEMSITRDMELEDLLLEIGAEKVIALSPRGILSPLGPLLEGDKIALLLGGFPEGDYISDVYSIADEVVALDTETLTTWSVTCEVLCALSAYQPLS